MPDTVPTVWTENRPTRGWRRVDLRELWAYRELAYFLARRDLSVRYKQAVFGVGWAILQPLAGVAAFTLVFRGLAKVPSDGIPYPLFALVGFTAWTYFSGTVAGATESLVSNGSLLTKVYFPRLAAPIAAALPGLVDLAVAGVVVVGFLVGYGVFAGVRILAVVPLLLLLVILSLGIGLWLATLHVKYRDARHVTSLLLQLWLFASPIAYPATLVDSSWRRVYEINPVVGVVGGLRWAVAGAPFPGSALATSVVISTIVLLGGVLFFARSERAFADII